MLLKLLYSLSIFSIIPLSSRKFEVFFVSTFTISHIFIKVFSIFFRAISGLNFSLIHFSHNFSAISSTSSSLIPFPYISICISHLYCIFSKFFKSCCKCLSKVKVFIFMIGARLFKNFFNSSVLFLLFSTPIV